MMSDASPQLDGPPDATPEWTESAEKKEELTQITTTHDATKIIIKLTLTARARTSQTPKKKEMAPPKKESSYPKDQVIFTLLYF